MPQTDASGRRAACRQSRGFTLIETLVSMVLMGLVATLVVLGLQYSLGVLILEREEAARMYGASTALTRITDDLSQMAHNATFSSLDPVNSGSGAIQYTLPCVDSGLCDSEWRINLHQDRVQLHNVKDGFTHLLCNGVTRLQFYYIAANGTYITPSDPALITSFRIEMDISSDGSSRTYVTQITPQLK